MSQKCLLSSLLVLPALSGGERHFLGSCPTPKARSKREVRSGLGHLCQTKGAPKSGRMLRNVIMAPTSAVYDENDVSRCMMELDMTDGGWSQS